MRKISLSLLSFVTAIGIISCSKAHNSTPSGTNATGEDPEKSSIYIDTAKKLEINKNTTLSLTEKLSGFSSCQEMKTYLEDLNIKQMHQDLIQQLRWKIQYEKYRDQHGGIMETNNGMGIPMPVEAPVSQSLPGSAKDAAGSTSGPDSSTGTNNQVDSVDEGDYIKNDGTYTYIANNSSLKIIKIWPAQDMNLVTSIPLTGYNFNLLLDSPNKKLILFSQQYYNNGQQGKIVPYAPNIDMPAFGPGGLSYVRIQTIDISEPAKAFVQKTVNVQGNLQEIRFIDSKAIAVVNNYLPYPSSLSYDIPDYYRLSVADFQKKILELSDQNSAKIHAMSLQDLLGLSQSQADLNLSTLVDTETCSNIKHPGIDSERGLTSIIQYAAGADTITSMNVIANSGIIYANEKSLYLAASEWWFGDEENSHTNQTYLHKFSIDSQGVQYKASGKIDGVVLNQFSLDEYNDDLRVATSVTKFTKTINTELWWSFDSSLTNKLSVIYERDGVLKVRSSIDNLAEGERIQSARFFGPKGFMVTFKQIDPLFTLDLTNPDKPVVAGELKVPGFSTYIHPLDATHILTAGVYVDPQNPRGSSQTPKITIFDVSDFANPREAFTYQLQDLSYGYSEVNWDHKAFTYKADVGILAIPVSGYNPSCANGYYWSCYVNRLNLFSINATTGIGSLGHMDMSDIRNVVKYDWWTYYTNAYINRSIISSGTSNGIQGNYVYAISNLGVRSALVSKIATPLNTVEFKN